jgi:microcin C transport system substrate-binding protein
MPISRAMGGGLLRWLRLFGVAMLLATLGPKAAAVPEMAGGVTTSHGYAVFGDLKYGPDFQHFDYVNPVAPRGGTFRTGQLGTFDSVNFIALLGTFPPTLMFLADSLMEQSRDEPGSYYCLICKSVSWPEDRSWAEFELRDDVWFDDGHRVDVEDVLFSAGLGKGLTVPAFSRVHKIVARVEQTGPRRVRFHFTMKNNPTPMTVIATMPVVPAHYWRGKDPFKPTLEIPVMLSPYKLVRAEPGRSLVFRRDPKYWGRNHPINRGRFNFDGLRNDYYRDQTLLNEAFRVGLSDLRMDTSANDIRQETGLAAVQSGDIRRIKLPYASGAIYNAMHLNSRRPFLSDRRVRRALMLAYDYEWVKRVVLGGEYGRLESNFPNSDFIASGLPGPGERAFLEPYRASLPPELFTQAPANPVGGSRAQMRANLLRARDLLREAGYRVADGRLVDPATGTPVRLKLLAYSPLLASQTALFIANARKLGIEIEFKAVDAAQMRHLIRNYDYDILYQRSVFAPLPTPGVGLALIWTSGAARTPNQLNYAGVSDPAIDAAIARMIAATDRQTVVDALRAVDRVARFQYYTIPLQHSYPAPVGTMSVAIWDKFGRPATEQTWNFPYYSADTWWIDPARQAALSHGIYR